MSLEDNIKELTLAVHRLTAALDVTTASVTPASTETVYEVELTAPEPKKPKAELKVVQNDPPAAEKAKDTPEQTHDKLKALCLDLVRKDPANRDKIKTVISSFGATLVSDVSVDKLPALAKQLLALGS